MENSSIKSFVKGWGKPSSLLPQSFFESSTSKVAQALIGKIFVVSHSDGDVAGRIFETEAYGGTDVASHSARGRTKRCEVMFGPPSVAYVYFIYGMYEMLNFVTEPDGQAGAVLIRAIEPLFGEDLMQRRRPSRSRLHLGNGPGKLCVSMGVQLAHSRQSLQGPSLFVYDDGYVPPEIVRSPRVGISKGVDALLRFFEKGNPWVSRAPQNRFTVPL